MNIEYTAGYKYRLSSDRKFKLSVYPEKKIVTEFIALTPQGILSIKRNYCWDGCSGPAIDTKTNMRGGLVHDALYQLMRQDNLSQKWREAADNELKRLCLEDGMWRLRAWYFYKGVRKRGLSSASAENRRKILIAP